MSNLCKTCRGCGMTAYWDGSAMAGEMCPDCGPSDAIDPVAAERSRLRSAVAQLPGYVYKEVFREAWPEDTHGIYQQADGGLVSRADVLALFSDPPQEQP